MIDLMIQISLTMVVYVFHRESGLAMFRLNDNKINIVCYMIISGFAAIYSYQYIWVKL